jgi:DNA-binding FadR family transcriptional regulator
VILSAIESDFLRYLLTDGREPGGRLPSLGEISVATGVSIGKLREQMEVARMLGMVEASPRRGLRILPYDFQPAVRLSLMVALSRDRSLFYAYSSLRVHLETAFWDEAVALLTDEDKAWLCELVASAAAKLSGDRIQIPHLEHRAFHLTIFGRLTNPFVCGLLEAYWAAYEAVELNTYADFTYLQEVWDYHRRITEAICAGEYAEGKQLLIAHMRLIDKLGIAHEGDSTGSPRQPASPSP